MAASKRNLLFSLLFVGIMIVNTSHLAMQPEQDLSASFLDVHNEPTQMLRELLLFFKLPTNDLNTIVATTQKQWLRPAGKERWEIDELTLSEAEQSILKKLFTQIGLIHEIASSKKEYDYAILLGSRLASAQKRINYLIELWKRGIRFNEIVVLSGQRSLDPSVESLEYISTVIKKPTTECGMMQAVLQSANAPEEFKKIPVTYIDVPMKIDKNGKSLRPTTADTINDWMKMNPKNGSCLLISSQPFVAYQAAVWKTLVPKDRFFAESVGAEVFQDNASISEILDTIARLLYQEKIRRN